MAALRWVRRGRRRRARTLVSAVAAVLLLWLLRPPRLSPSRPVSSRPLRLSPSRPVPSRPLRWSPSFRSAAERGPRSRSPRPSPSRRGRLSPSRRWPRPPSRLPSLRSSSPRRPRRPASLVVTSGSLRPDPMISRVSAPVRSAWPRRTDVTSIPSMNWSTSTRSTSPTAAPSGTRSRPMDPFGCRAPWARHVQSPSSRALVNWIFMRGMGRNASRLRGIAGPDLVYGRDARGTVSGVFLTHRQIPCMLSQSAERPTCDCASGLSPTDGGEVLHGNSTGPIHGGAGGVRAPGRGMWWYGQWGRGRRSGSGRHHCCSCCSCCDDRCSCCDDRCSGSGYDCGSGS